MKSLSIIMILSAIMMITGCATDGITVPAIDQDSKELIAKISGRRIGASLQEKYPDIAGEVSFLCQEIAGTDEPDIIDIAIRKLVKILANEVDDPLLAADISDLMELLHVKTGIEISPDRLAIIVSAARGLANGVELQKGEK